MIRHLANTGTILACDWWTGRWLGTRNAMQ